MTFWSTVYQHLFKGYFSDTELVEYDRRVEQPAVYAVASTWKKIWGKFKK